MITSRNKLYSAGCFISSPIAVQMLFLIILQVFIKNFSAGVALPCYNITEPQPPLQLNAKQNLLRLYMDDYIYAPWYMIMFYEPQEKPTAMIHNLDLSALNDI